MMSAWFGHQLLFTVFNVTFHEKFLHLLYFRAWDFQSSRGREFICYGKPPFPKVLSPTALTLLEKINFSWEISVMPDVKVGTEFGRWKIL